MTANQRFRGEQIARVLLLNCRLGPMPPVTPCCCFPATFSTAVRAADAIPMALHPFIQQALDAAGAAPAYHTLPLAQARETARKGYLLPRQQVAVAGVRDMTIPGPAGALGARIYTPHGAGPHPVLVFFHGSGFVVLDLDTHDDICRRLCVGGGCVVVSVDYRLAPEHRFPAAPDDCLAATRWVAAHGGELGADTGRIALGGDSAGGCLAAVTALRLRDDGAGTAVRALLMLYPVTDLPGPQHASYRDYGAGFGLTAEGMGWFWEQYLPRAEDADHPHAAPLRAVSVHGLPPCYVLTAEHDVLRSEGEAFARRLHAAGVPTETRCSRGMNHGFLKYTGVLAEADAEMAHACGWLRRALS